MKEEKVNRILALIASDYNTTPHHICAILDELIDRAWSEEARLAGERRLQAFDEKPSALEYLSAILSDSD